jgi:hypothetical protein
LNRKENSADSESARFQPLFGIDRPIFDIPPNEPLSARRRNTVRANGTIRHRSIWRTPNQDRWAPLRRLEISFGQGAEWKALNSKYIGTISLSDDASCGRAEHTARRAVTQNSLWLRTKFSASIRMKEYDMLLKRIRRMSL